MLAELAHSAKALWKEIPDAELPEACKEALCSSNGFVPSLGLVVQSWRKGQKTLAQREAEAQSEIRRQNDARYALPDPEKRPPTSEERDHIAAMMREVRYSLDPEARIRDLAQKKRIPGEAP